MNCCLGDILVGCILLGGCGSGVCFGLGLILLGRALSGRFRRLDSWVVWCGLCLLVCFGGFRL